MVGLPRTSTRYTKFIFIIETDEESRGLTVEFHEMCHHLVFAGETKSLEINREKPFKADGRHVRVNRQSLISSFS